MNGRFIRLDETDRNTVTLWINGQQHQALEGDTLMMAILCNQQGLRSNEFGDHDRAGFCLMGACQDCWVWTESGQRIRSCSTYVTEGMKIVTQEPEAVWNVHELSL
ncbi:Hydrogen cyanide synthase subunit HcnA [Vibrio aerogenes CECT 7868]|uniref:Hydrogen cyanide synthase subunit HcnA n=1 Tax=Vibrio aerogenes CECT 7868 TaxID=1216006 RepID=A0A1M6D4L8_9VIBR|nr:(2Fe-2S)-binding protein [Vibrio aerogenes]SHI68215.1 Hydrogen cyanide synthase subunit HcnA [Vibrio aerogenes CECT 7868]